MEELQLKQSKFQRIIYKTKKQLFTTMHLLLKGRKSSIINMITRQMVYKFSHDIDVHTINWVSLRFKCNCIVINRIHLNGGIRIC